MKKRIRNSPKMRKTLNNIFVSIASVEDKQTGNA